jgi:hypothetical protein
LLTCNLRIAVVLNLSIGEEIEAEARPTEGKVMGAAEEDFSETSELEKKVTVKEEISEV